MNYGKDLFTLDHLRTTLSITTGTGASDINMQKAESLFGYRLKKNSPALNAGKVIQNNGGKNFGGEPNCARKYKYWRMVTVLAMLQYISHAVSPWYAGLTMGLTMLEIPD